MVLGGALSLSSSSSLSSLTKGIGGTGEAIAKAATATATATATAAAAATTTATPTTVIITTTTTIRAITTTTTAVAATTAIATTGAATAVATVVTTEYDKERIDYDNVGRRERNIRISSSSSLLDRCSKSSNNSDRTNCLDSVMLATVSTSSSSSSSLTTPALTSTGTTIAATTTPAAATTTTTPATTATTTAVATKTAAAAAVAVAATGSSSSSSTISSTTNNLPLNSTRGTTLTTDDILLDELSSRFHGVLPVQPSPLLLPSDHISSSLKSTRLNGHLIYCFVIGGECRLCFPQIISVVLRDVAISDINELFVNLNIHISVASQQQLETLKLAGVMPMTADSCGLITKSDAERLVAKLLPQCNGYRLKTIPPPSPHHPTITTTTTTTTTGTGTGSGIITVEATGAGAGATYRLDDAIPVMHDCFDGCTGTLMLMLDSDEQIECTHCKLLFTGEKFVSHSHSIRRHRICHWGFDSSNWRHYLHLPDAYEDDVKALQKLELYKYPPPIRLGKRSAASHHFMAVENGTCPKVANLTVTGATKSVEMDAEAEIGVGGIEILENKVDPVVSTSSSSSIQALNELSEHILKLNTAAAQTTAVLATALTATSTAPTTAATVTQNSSALPVPVPMIGANGCYPGQSSSSSVTSLLSPQLQSLLALQLVTSQLPLTEQYRLPLSTTNNPSSHVTPSDIRCKTLSETQSSTLPSIPMINSNKLSNDLKQHGIINDRDLSNKGASSLLSSTNNLDLTTTKTGTSLERLLDQTLKEPVLSVAKLLAAEFRREKELLLNQNEQLRRENILLRSALASSTVLVGLKGLNGANVPVL